MTADMLSACLALAATGLILLGLTFRPLLQIGGRPWPTRPVLLAATRVLTVGLLWIDIVIIWCLVEYSLFAVDFSSDGLRALIGSADRWALIASIGLMAVHAFVTFPAEVIAVANGVAFGPWLGVLVTWVGAMVGAILSYEAMCALGPAARAHLVPVRYRSRLDALTRNRGIAPLLMACPIPVMSFSLIHYAAGLAGVPRARFIWTTGLGILPLTVLSVLLGSQALTLPIDIWILAGPIALLLLSAIRRIRRRRSILQSAEPSQSESCANRHCDTAP